MTSRLIGRGTAPPSVQRSVGRGRVWRALLSGEKEGKDMLDAWHYLRAANRLVAGMVSTVWGFVRPLALPLGLLFLLLAGGIALLVLAPEGGQIVGVIATVVAALGITGAGIRARLGQATTQLQTFLWGAELDLAVADAVLIGPEGWNAELGDVPAIGPVPKAASNLETLQEFRKALRDDKSRQRKGSSPPCSPRRPNSTTPPASRGRAVTRSSAGC